VLVGRDKGQQRRPIELRALREHKVRKFTLVGSHLRGDEIATALVAAWPRLRRLCAEGTAPLLGKIYRDGRVEVVEPL
jgi:hypothetical protein